MEEGERERERGWEREGDGLAEGGEGKRADNDPAGAATTPSWRMCLTRGGRRDRERMEAIAYT